MILESRPTRSASVAGAVLNFSPNGIRVLAGLGLEDTINQRNNGIEVPSISMYDSSGSFLGKVPHGSKQRYGHSSLMTTRLEIHEVLLEDAEKRGIEVRYGAKVNKLQELDDGVVVKWSENTQEKELKVDLVVGADGIWSVVRQRQARADTHADTWTNHQLCYQIFAAYMTISNAHALSQHTKA
jgi:2-polyprenyl-6-methoxyphenol hydroxylase-like FAD-dependent oxidoreductase